MRHEWVIAAMVKSSIIIETDILARNVRNLAYYVMQEQGLHLLTHFKEILVQIANTLLTPCEKNIEIVLILFLGRIKAF